MRIFLIILTFLTTSDLFAYSNGPPTGVAGEPPHQNTCYDCHRTFQLNTGEGGINLLGLPDNGYEPGETYRLEVVLADSNARRWGFEMTAINDDNEGVGDLESVNNSVTRVDNGGNKQYALQIRAGTYAGSRLTASWEIDWTAPEEDIGEVFFFFTGNAANNNGGNTGDYIYSNSESITALEVPDPDEFTLTLDEGWNFVSSPVIPEDAELTMLFADLIESESLIMIRDMDGNIFDPMEDIDEIGNWDPVASYEILMDQADEVLFSGMFSDSLMIQLESQWNWIAYTRTDTIHPAEAFSMLEDNDQVMFWAKDRDHHFYVPGYDFNGLGMINPGDGMKLHYTVNQMDSMNVFSWPEPMGGQRAPFEWVEPEFNQPADFDMSTSMSLLVTELNGIDPQEGDEIIVYETMDEQLMEYGRILGVGVVTDEETVPIVVWGESDIDYDSLLTFAYYSVMDEEVSTFMLSAERFDGDENLIRFEEDTFVPIGLTPTVVDAAPLDVQLPERIALVSVYPNPFNGRADVEFSLREKGNVTIQLIDLSGRLVQTIDNRTFSSGNHTVGFNGSNLSTGMYMIEIVGDGIRQYKRVVLLK